MVPAWLRNMDSQLEKKENDMKARGQGYVEFQRGLLCGPPE